MEIGARLKEARVAQNLSLDSLQETTKIQKRYLLAIEEGNFQILPGKFYARAFIKEYAAAVGLDPNELLEEYKDEVPKTEEDNEVQYTRMQRTKKVSNPEKSSNVFSIIPTIIVILLVIGIFAVAWYFIQQAMATDGSQPVEDPNDNVIINEPADNENPSNADSGAEDEETASGTDENGSADETGSDSEGGEDTEDTTESENEGTFEVVEESAAGGRAEATLDFAHNSDEVEITMESSGDTWLEVENEAGESLYYNTLTEEASPEELTVASGESIYFNIGNASDLTITINGTELEYPANPDEYVVQQIWVNVQ
ncbi:helix-turn-helix domain-containing protein [Lentibacillus sediminis]|uniref:helix-turn-helix domain-containing protein n=1 Tax=Lentibacillus sediminis TaxID=1940529 RepID=UPI000C1C3031|nr:RodZ domain-containing protein [Lentibacillus sediminis]